MICILQNIWKIRLQLTKPVTWPPLVWGVVCGAAASGTHLCKFLNSVAFSIINILILLFEHFVSLNNTYAFL